MRGQCGCPACKREDEREFVRIIRASFTADDVLRIVLAANKTQHNRDIVARIREYGGI